MPNLYDFSIQELKNPIKIAERLQSRLEQVDDCLIWQGATDTGGYGIIRISVLYGGTCGKNSRIEATHRVTYVLANKFIPQHLVIDHLCRNILCCNVEHLELVTPEENTKRSHKDNPRAKERPNRRIKECSKCGNTELIINKFNQSICRPCKNEYARQYRLAGIKR